MQGDGPMGLSSIAEHCKPASDGFGHPAITPPRNLQALYRRYQKLGRHLQYTAYMQSPLSGQERLYCALASRLQVSWTLCQRVAPAKLNLPGSLKSLFQLQMARTSSFTKSIYTHTTSHSKTRTPPKRSNDVDKCLQHIMSEKKGTFQNTESVHSRTAFLRVLPYPWAH